MQFFNPHPKKYKGVNFHEDWPYRTRKVMTISFTENSKWWISEKKKGLKFPNFKSRYLRNCLELGEKIVLTFVSYK